MANITFSESTGLNDSVFQPAQGPVRLFLEKRGEQYEQQSVLKNLFQMSSSNHYKLYRLYLAALIHFANGEYDRYQNSMALFNSACGEYIRWFSRVKRPAESR